MFYLMDMGETIVFKICDLLYLLFGWNKITSFLWYMWHFTACEGFSNMYYKMYSAEYGNVLEDHGNYIILKNGKRIDLW